MNKMTVDNTTAGTTMATETKKTTRKQNVRLKVVNNPAPTTDETKKMLFNNVLNNAHTYGYDAEGNPVVASCQIPLSLCYVDERYQGLRQHKKLGKLVANWDIAKCEPITIVPHPETYEFAIIDGKGRYNAATILNLKELPATILKKAPIDPEERLKWEAKFFISQNDETEQLKDVEKHLARVLNGDRAALIIERICEKYGIEKMSATGKHIVSALGSYKATYNIAKAVNGEDVLNFGCSIVCNAKWDGRQNGFNEYLLSAFKNIYNAHPENIKRIHEYLSTALTEYDYRSFRHMCIANYPKRSVLAAMTLTIENMVCDTLNIPKKIYIDEEGNYIKTK